jgi:hypothetical protein
MIFPLVGIASTPHPLYIANKDKFYTCYTQRRKTKREEKEVAINAMLARGGRERGWPFSTGYRV